MSQDLWNAVDRYICDALVPHDAALEAALESSAAAGLPAIHVAPNQGTGRRHGAGVRNIFNRQHMGRIAVEDMIRVGNHLMKRGAHAIQFPDGL